MTHSFFLFSIESILLMFEKFSIRFVFVIIVYLESREILGFKMEDEGEDSDSEKITAIVSLPFCSCFFTLCPTKYQLHAGSHWYFYIDSARSYDPDSNWRVVKR